MEKERIESRKIQIVSFLIQTIVLGSLYIYSMILIWYRLQLPQNSNWAIMMFKITLTVVLILGIALTIKIIEKVQSKAMQR